jgi:hypothetical protein
MFRILRDPSSGNAELCLTEITRSDSQIFCRVFGRCVAATLNNGSSFSNVLGLAIIFQP